MSEDFLSRWSRRKREVAKAEQEPLKPAQPEAQAPEEVPEATPVAREPQKSDEVDLSSLPSLEEITGSTDISGFLGRDVPEELTRAALRKAWTSDPTVRDFIGPSENAWDFNDPTAIPGFGPIDFSTEQVRQMAAKLVGTGEQIGRVAASAMQQGADALAPSEREKTKDAAQTTAAAPVADRPSDAASQGDMPDDSDIVRAPRHGGALPR
jgi:Protein of unknown function (DUF3306)